MAALNKNKIYDYRQAKGLHYIFTLIPGPIVEFMVMEPMN